MTRRRALAISVVTLGVFVSSAVAVSVAPPRADVPESVIDPLSIFSSRTAGVRAPGALASSKPYKISAAKIVDSDTAIPPADYGLGGNDVPRDYSPSEWAIGPQSSYDNPAWHGRRDFSAYTPSGPTALDEPWGALLFAVGLAAILIIRARR